MFAFLFLPLDSETALYLVLFAILIFSGIGLPIPEEVTLLLGGYLAYLEFVNFWAAVWVLIAGIILADIGGYLLGRFAGEWISKKFFSYQWTVSALKKAEKYFEKYGEKVVIFSRPLLGVRVAVPILAGHFRMNFAKFILFDAAAAIPWTVFLATLSYYLGSGLDLITEVRLIKHTVFILVGIVIVLYAAIKFIGNDKEFTVSEPKMRG